MTNSKLKDSNIEWLGKIPSNWRLIHNKYILKKKKEILSKYDNEKILSLTMNGVIERDLNAGGKMPSSFDGYQKLKKDNLLLCLFDIDVTPRCVGIIPKDGITSPAYSQFILNKKKAYLKYYYYYFLMLDNKKVLVHLSKNLRNTLSEQEFGSLTSLMPPLEEQKKISTFLDKKIGKIDKVSKKIQQEITDLEEYRKSIITKAVTKGLNPNVPMKDSGIPWIGEIPQNWKIIKGKYLFRLLSKPVKKDDQVITCFRDGQVTLRVKRRTTGFTMSDQEIGYQGIDKGDLVVHGMDGFAGAIGISDSRGKGSPVLNVLDSNQDKKYMMYCLRATAQLGVFQALAKGIRVRSADTRWPTLANLKYAIPPQSEQANVVNYLSNNSYKLNAIIQAKKDLVEKLNQYKQSIIYEYVTGKKQVPTEEGAVEWEARLTNAMNINNTSLIN